MQDLGPKLHGEAPRQGPDACLVGPGLVVPGGSEVERAPNNARVWPYFPAPLPVIVDPVSKPPFLGDALVGDVPTARERLLECLVSKGLETAS